MHAYRDKPWLARYREGQPDSIEPEQHTMLEVFRASVARMPGQVAVRYFDGELAVADLDRASDALAAALAGKGFRPGDRLAVFTQNNPGFVIGLLAAWKAGGVAVPVNAMNKGRELAYLLGDSGARALLCLDRLYASVAREVIASGQTSVDTVITTSELDWQTRNDERVLEVPRLPAPDGALDLLTVISAYAGQRPDVPPPGPGDVAVLAYTSGTTGRPKGAMNTHGTMVYGCCNFREWMDLSPADSVLGVAPLFHITGLVGHVGLSLLLPCPLVLTHRFDSAVMLDALREHRPTFTVAAITALTRLADEASGQRRTSPRCVSCTRAAPRSPPR